MECLSTVSVQAILPKFVRNFFTRKDDASFWGGEEDLDPVTHCAHTPYARTETVKYKSAHDGPAIPSIESIKKTWDGASDCSQAEKNSGESFLRVYVVS